MEIKRNMRDLFGQDEGMHDKQEMKRLFLEGSITGKKIIKKTAQLEESKRLLTGVSENTSIDELKKIYSEMLRTYDSGKTLETKMGYLEKTKDKVKILSMCYNLVASKIDTLEGLKSEFDSEVEGF